MRYLAFRGDQGKQHYGVIQIALAQSGRRNSPNDLATITELTRTLRTIGDEVDEVAQQGIKIPLFELKDGGGQIELESAEFRMLQELIDKTPWQAALAIHVTELRQFLKDAPKDRPKTTDEPESVEDEEAVAERQTTLDAAEEAGVSLPGMH